MSCELKTLHEQRTSARYPYKNLGINCGISRIYGLIVKVTFLVEIESTPDDDISPVVRVRAGVAHGPAESPAGKTNAI
jgi:hypothetical protein